MSDDLAPSIGRAVAEAGAPDGRAFTVNDIRSWLRGELPPAKPHPYRGFSWLTQSTHRRGKTAIYAAACFLAGPVELIFGTGPMWKLRKLDFPADPFDALAEFEHHFPPTSRVETNEDELRRWLGPTGYREWG